MLRTIWLPDCISIYIKCQTQKRRETSNFNCDSTVLSWTKLHPGSPEFFSHLVWVWAFLFLMAVHKQEFCCQFSWDLQTLRSPWQYLVSFFISLQHPGAAWSPWNPVRSIEAESLSSLTCHLRSFYIHPFSLAPWIYIRTCPCYVRVYSIILPDYSHI